MYKISLSGLLVQFSLVIISIFFWWNEEIEMRKTKNNQNQESYSFIPSQKHTLKVHIIYLLSFPGHDGE